MFTLFSALLLALLPGDDDVGLTPVSDADVLYQIILEGTERSEVMDHLEVLCEDFGPRLTGSEALTASCEWARDTFESLGLEARLEHWGDVAWGFERGPSRGAIVSPEVRELTFLTRAWSAGTDGNLRGPAVLAATDDDQLAAHAGQVAGAWILTPFPDPEAPLTREFVDRRNAFYAAQDVAGTVRPSPAGELLIMSGNRRVMDGNVEELPTSVSVTLHGAEFAEIAERVAAGEAIDLLFDIDNRFVEGPIPQFNVVADLRGEIHPDEYVLVGGHIDSWDGATGATDNATGCAVAIEAARLLVESGARPGRTIRFMLWGGEEQGLLGSRASVELDEELMGRISAVLNHDDGTNPVVGLPVTRAMSEQMARVFQPVVELSERTDGVDPFELEVVPGLAPGASDHNAYLAEGVPAFSWRQDGRALYADTHHTQLDHPDRVDAEAQAYSATVAAIAALGLADLPEMLDRRGLRRVSRRLGVGLADDGVTVTFVQSGSRAAKLGVEAGDVFVTVNGAPIGEEGVARVRDRGEGRKLFGWQRGEETFTGVFEWDPGDIERDPQRVELVTGDSVTIVGDYYMGAVDAPASGSALILLPMNRGDRHQWIPLRDELYAAGIATLALDPRGHGESLDEAGELAAMLERRDPALYAGMVADVAAAVAWLEARGYPAGRIGLMGASVGASVAIRAAADDPRLAGAAALTPGSAYLGMDSLADVARWDDRPLLLVSSEEEADRGARPLHAALLGGNRWTAAQLVLLPERSIHGTRMFGVSEGVEDRLAAWWVDVLR